MVNSSMYNTVCFFKVQQQTLLLLETITAPLSKIDSANEVVTNKGIEKIMFCCFTFSEVVSDVVSLC